MQWYVRILHSRIHGPRGEWLICNFRSVLTGTWAKSRSARAQLNQTYLTNR